MKVRALVFALAASLAAGATALAQFPARSRYAVGYMYSYYVPPSAGTPWRPAWSPDGFAVEN